MESKESLLKNGWVQKGKPFGSAGAETCFCILVKGNKVMVLNQYFDTCAVQQFSVPLVDGEEAHADFIPIDEYHGQEC